VTKAKTQDNIPPRAPKKGPKPTVDSVPVPDVELSGPTSPLAAYMDIRDLSMGSMCKVTGIDHKTLKALKDGHAVPSLVTAYLIELSTKGAVPMESWMGTPRARITLQQMMERMPEEVQESLRPGFGGGFASPLEKQSGGRGKRKQPVTKTEDDNEESGDEDVAP